MEEKKLLRILILLIIALKSHFSLAEESDNKWARNIASNNQSIAMSNIKEMMNIPGFDPNIKNEVLNPRPILQIFVSSSMSKELLKQYAIEAKRCGGVLVFRGLPSGSMQKLIKLVTSISSEDSAAMQIDDLAFKAFEISAVPAIVLSKASQVFDVTSSEKFDKITGAISIKAALELFASSGDRKKEARELLQ